MPQDIESRSPEEGLSPDRKLAIFLRSIRGCALLMLDTVGQIVISNYSTKEVTGYTEDELRGKPYCCLFPEEDQQNEVPAHDLDMACRQGFYESSRWLNRKDGSQLWSTLSLSPAYDDAGILYGYAVMIRDIADKRATEDALFDSERQFRILVEGVRDYAIYMLDPDGCITNWNAGAALIKGYSATEIIGRHFSTFYTEDDRERGEPQRGLDTALRDNTFQNEAWRVRKDGTLFWASIVIDPIYDEHGKLLGFAKVTRDITDKKLDQERIAQQRESQHQSQKLEALGRLTGSVAHDFNNMLSIIRTAAEMLGSGMRLAHDTSHYVNMITDASERAARLTDQLLSFARQRPFRLEVFSPASRLEGMVHVLEATLGSRNQLVIDVAPDISSIESDSSQFDTAILNLVINARDAMDEGGPVTITGRNVKAALEHDGDIRDWVTIEVRDVGTGIDPETLAKIFEPFFTTKAIDKGTGLGLSQVYGFVRQSGGDVKVVSAPRQGTSFTLYLPQAGREKHDPWAGLLTETAEKEHAGSLLANGKG